MTKIIRNSRPKLRSILFTILNVLFLLILSTLIVGCRSKEHAVLYKGQDMRQLVRAGMRLGFDIQENDNWQLMLNASEWLGVPYCYGGNTKSGVDCSGLSKALYRDVFGVNLHRRSIEQYNQDCVSVSKSKVREGDLVFFSSDRKKGNINHVGVYLRDEKFIHASSSKGVIVSSLTENYYKRIWVGCGRVKR